MNSALSWAERLGGDEFLAQTFSRTHHVSRGPAGAFDSLLTWDTLNTLLTTHRLQPPRLRLSAGGDLVDPDRYATTVTNRRSASWHHLQPAEVHARLAEGASLVLDSVHEMHPPLAAASAALERFVRTTVQVNLYASLTPEPGFGVHWDDHAVIACQLRGAKRWQIYGPTREAPGWVDVDFPQEPRGEPLAEIVLTDGDLLYLPRGWWHCVAADTGEQSLHLTFGLTGPSTGADLLHWLVDQMRARLLLRQDAPRFAGPGEQNAYVARLRTELLAELDAGLVERWAASVDVTHPGYPHTSLPHITNVPAEAEVTVTLACPRARLDTGSAASVTLRGAGGEWEFALPVRPVLQALMPGVPIALGDLADRAGLPVEAVAEIVTVLVQGQAAVITGGGR
ncbi:cupin [Streptomyces sp. NRRL B-1677]|uniref:cupin domain-containing protein n=1 Tax=Streptomyces sp. NRRL B-1677 TaxID=2682966 RepID=UPI001892C782|nr:cupin domain-containing protein [Streptomyces sp. NRRL B-1677]MBF6050135.1 cupin [Streptomyces sp. NRRL B-1677]